MDTVDPDETLLALISASCLRFARVSPGCLQSGRSMIPCQLPHWEKNHPSWEISPGIFAFSLLSPLLVCTSSVGGMLYSPTPRSLPFFKVIDGSDDLFGGLVFTLGCLEVFGGDDWFYPVTSASLVMTSSLLACLDWYFFYDISFCFKI